MAGLYLDRFNRRTGHANELNLESIERAARCRALDARLVEMGIHVEHPPFAPGKVYNAGMIAAARAAYLRRLEALLLGALSVACQSTGTDSGPGRGQ